MQGEGQGMSLSKVIILKTDFRNEFKSIRILSALVVFGRITFNLVVLISIDQIFANV